MLHAVTCLFNPCGYRRLVENHRRFAAALGAPLTTVELSFDGRFEIPGALQVRGDAAKHTLWQKERLLNLAIAALPPEADRVAWIDADLLFLNPNWAEAAERVLDDATHAAARRNPLCGDEIAVSVRVEDGRAAAIRWEGRGCVLSRACASLLCEAAEGRPVAELSELDEATIADRLGLSLSPAKRTCAALAPLALRAALGIHKHSRSNERDSPGSSCVHA